MRIHESLNLKGWPVRLSLPATFTSVISIFVSVFSRPVWQPAKVLLAGAILAPGKRTVSSVLRLMGQADEPHFQTYHRVLNRASWASLKASRFLLRFMLAIFIPWWDTLVFGLDDTIERRWGQQIKARGIYRDPVRSSHSHVVKVSGLRWLCGLLLSPIPWAKRVWALPFLSVLCPSERFYLTTRSSSPKLDRASLATDSPAQTLVAETRVGLCHRQQLCRFGAAGSGEELVRNGSIR